jgi:preprotein translocase subunit SecY
LEFPGILSNFFGADDTGFWGKVLRVLSQSNWCDPNHPVRSIGLIVYLLLIVLFSFFYTSITFNPIEISNNMKKSGGFVPGIRPGKPTSDYITKVLSRLTLVGALLLSVVALYPILFSQITTAIQTAIINDGETHAGVNLSLGGTSVIILVGVALETVKQLESQMMMRHYKGFLD